MTAKTNKTGMLSLRITELLSHLDKAGLKELEKLIQSPFFSTGRNIAPLFKELKKFHPGFNHKEITEANLYTRAYGKKEFNKTVFRKLVSDLTTVAEEYIRWRFYSSNEPVRALALSNGYALINDFDGMKKALQQTEKKFDKLKVNHDYYEYLYELQQHYIHYYQSKADIYTTQGENVILRGNHFVMNFLVRLPQQLHDIIVIKEGYYSGKTPDIILGFASCIDIEKFINTLKLNNDVNYDIAALYGYNALLWTDKGNPEIFRKALSLYRKNIGKLDNMDKYILGILMGTFCTKTEIEGNPELIPELAGLYEFMLKENVLSGVYGKFIPGQIFTDYINRLAQLGKLEEAETVIKNTSGLLHPDAKNKILNLCNALLFTVKGNYEDSIELLKNMNPEEIKEKTSVKSLMAINYFELGYFENLLSLIEAAKKFIAENKFMTPSRKEYTSAFYSLLKKITIFKLNGADEFKIKELIEQINNTRYTTHRRWLLEKAESL